MTGLRDSFRVLSIMEIIGPLFGKQRYFEIKLLRSSHTTIQTIHIISVLKLSELPTKTVS